MAGGGDAKGAVKPSFPAYCRLTVLWFLHLERSVFIPFVSLTCHLRNSNSSHIIPHSCHTSYIYIYIYIYNINAYHICLGCVMADVVSCLFSHCGGLVSVPGRSVWDLWWIVWHLDVFFLLWVLHFFLIISFNQCSILICWTVTDVVYS